MKYFKGGYTTTERVPVVVDDTGEAEFLLVRINSEGRIHFDFKTGDLYDKVGEEGRQVVLRCGNRKVLIPQRVYEELERCIAPLKLYAKLNDGMGISPATKRARFASKSSGQRFQEEFPDWNVRAYIDDLRQVAKLPTTVD